MTGIEGRRHDIRLGNRGEGKRMDIPGCSSRKSLPANPLLYKMVSSDVDPYSYPIPSVGITDY